MQAYILLDRSGSMQSLWVEALSSVNAYAKELANKKDGPTVDSHITLAVFDEQAGLQFDVLRRKQPALHWETVTDADASPRGMTPLLDSLIRIIALADADKPDKAVIVVMTDGQENASKEVTRDGVKAALERVKAKGWEVVFLGANFDNVADASSVGRRRPADGDGRRHDGRVDGAPREEVARLCGGSGRLGPDPVRRRGPRGRAGEQGQEQVLI